MNFTIPNLLSLLRMGIIPLFIIALLNGQPMKALLLFCIAGVTDALDGLIARFWKQQSVLGMYLDPAADKLLLMSAYVMLSVPSLNPVARIPMWVTVLVIARDVLIVVVALILYLALNVPSFPPSWIGKVNTVLQVTTAIVVMVAHVEPRAAPVALMMIYAVAGLAVVSGLDYVQRANRMTDQRGNGSGA